MAEDLESDILALLILNKRRAGLKVIFDACTNVVR